MLMPSANTRITNFSHNESPPLPLNKAPQVRGRMLLTGVLLIHLGPRDIFCGPFSGCVVFIAGRNCDLQTCQSFIRPDSGLVAMVIWCFSL